MIMLTNLCCINCTESEPFKIEVSFEKIFEGKNTFSTFRIIRVRNFVNFGRGC